MFRKLPISIVIALLLFPRILLGGNASSFSVYPRDYYERFVIRALVQIQAAQMTYSATFGNGNFASTLEDLRQGDFIDPALASGSKYGYTFEMSATPGSPGTPASFFVLATPQRYPKTGRRSFFIDTLGELHGGDKNGGIATAADPYIDSCALWGMADNERCSIQALRTLHGAEMTYASTYGNGNYGFLSQLGEAFLIGRTLATGWIHGYTFAEMHVSQIPGFPATIKIYVTPQIYGTTGVRSFFIDTSGVLRGADKNGALANENDPPIDQ